MAERKVVIIGGGFSGTALAIQLASMSDFPLDITVVEPRPALGEGVAYSTREPALRINVPARKMQLGGRPDGDFERWCQQQPDYVLDAAAHAAHGDYYPQRHLFGRYVAEHFAAAASARPGVTLRHLQDSALDVSNGQVLTHGGQILAADAVVLAVSHPPPAIPAALRPYADDPRLISNPWASGALQQIAPNERVVIMGSGLSMADVVGTLAEQGHRGEILAFSRRGQRPRPNFPGGAPQWEGDYGSQPVSGVRSLLRQVRLDVERAAAEGLPWQSVLDSVRASGQWIWLSLPLAEQRRFLRHLRSWWDVHRYRLAPQLGRLLERLEGEGRFSLHAARLQSLRARSDFLELTLNHGGQATITTADRLVLTTGPAHGGLIESQPLLRSLHAQGAIRADAQGLGLAVDVHSQALGVDGAPVPGLWVAGPAARGRFGELMGLPQVAEHAVSVAYEVLAALHHPQPHSARCPVC